MEQRLIDADALKVSYCKQCLKETRNEQIEVKQTPYCVVACQDFDVIDKQPTVDAVPVVRCKDCKHHEVFKNGVNGFCNEHERPTDVTYFCADGERKQEE